MESAHWIAGPIGARLLLLGAGAMALAAIKAPFPPLAAAAIAAIAGVLIMMLCARAWRSFCDEVVRAAHKAGWLWGGTAGLVAVLTFSVWLQKTGPIGLPAWVSATRPNDLLVTGMMIAVSAQMVGYLVFWAGWWVKKH